MMDEITAHVFTGMCQRCGTTLNFMPEIDDTVELPMFDGGMVVVITWKDTIIEHECNGTIMRIRRFRDMFKIPAKRDIVDVQLPENP